MKDAKLSFRTWLIAIYLISQSKKSTSSLALNRSLGVSYNTAWLVQQKIMHALKNADDCSALQGMIHVDNSYPSCSQPFLTALSFTDDKSY